MTSKEALKELKEEKIYLSNVNANEVLDAIEKDLEILEILKKHIYFSSKSGCIRMHDIYKSINNFDFEDLKGWLKDETGTILP